MVNISSSSREVSLNYKNIGVAHACCVDYILSDEYY